MSKIATQEARIGLVTGAAWPELWTDDWLLRDALRARGARVEPVVWTQADPRALRGRYDALVLRSCWDYAEALPEFLRWLERAEGARLPLCNDARLVRWNLEKGYLLELADQGVPIVPTRYLPTSPEPPSLQALLEEQGWSEAVVKPAVSLGALRTARVRLQDAGSLAAGQALLTQILEGGAALVQPYLRDIEQAGELSLLFAAGELTHAVRKRPKGGDFRVQEIHGGTSERVPVSAGLLAQARAVLEVVAGRLRMPTYARVDGLVEGERLLLMELELIEPCLFLSLDPGAAARFAAAVMEAALTPPGA